MRFILILLISQFTFASEISTSECINKVQEFLKLSDNEAISLTGEGHRSKECFLDIFTKKEANNQGELVFLQEVLGKKRGVTEVRLMTFEEKVRTSVKKCKVKDDTFILRFNQMNNESRRRVTHYVRLKKNESDKVVKAKLTRRLSSYRINAPINSRTNCKF